MDFAQAEARFNHLRDQLRDGTISRAEFVQAVGQIIVYDAQGRYWTLDPRTGHWLYFDGQTWIEALGQSRLPTVQTATPAGTPPPYPYPQDEEDGPNWLLLGIAGLAVLALCMLGAIAAAIIIGVGAAGGSQPAGPGPTVQIQSPVDGVQVQVNQEIVVQSISADARGVTRVELWIDGNLGPVTFSPDESGQPTLVATQSWTFLQPGAHTIQVRARNRANVEGTSPSITVHVSGTAPGTTPSPGQPGPTGTVPTACTDDNTFIADVTIPDGTRVRPGTTVDKVWRLGNTGTCSWGAGYRWIYVSGERMGAPESVAVPATDPGQETDLRVVFTAPQAPGTYVSRWQMQAPDNTPFGVVAILSIVVQPAGPTATTKPKPTPTPTVAPTPGPVISFTVDKKKITAGNCTNLRWDVEYVREVWLKEGGDPEYPEVGHKVKEICPTVNTTYVLRVVKYDGTSESRSITVKVTP